MHKVFSLSEREGTMYVNIYNYLCKEESIDLNEYTRRKVSLATT